MRSSLSSAQWSCFAWRCRLRLGSSMSEQQPASLPGQGWAFWGNLGCVTGSCQDTPCGEPMPLSQRLLPGHIGTEGWAIGCCQDPPLQVHMLTAALCAQGCGREFMGLHGRAARRNLSGHHCVFQGSQTFCYEPALGAVAALPSALSRTSEKARQ